MDEGEGAGLAMRVTDRTDWADDLPGGRLSDLVGRQREWQEAVHHAGRAAQGRGGILLLVGEAGIGKTALLTHLGHWATSAAFRVLTGQHRAHLMAPPLHGLRHALRPLFGLEPDESPKALGQRVSAAVARDFPALELHQQLLVEFLEPLAARSASGLRYLEPEHRALLLHVLYRLLATAAQSQPLVLVLDDLHWADGLTIDVLRYMAPLLADHRVLVCGAYREEQANTPGAMLRALAVDDGVTACSLSRLGLDEVTRLAGRHGLSADAGFCQALWAQSEGVPLYVEQWLLACRSAADRPLADVLAVPPASVSQVIRQRLERVPEPALPVLHAAAVIGDGCPARLVAHASGRPLMEVLSVLAALEQAHGLIQPAAGGGFAFHHGLVRQAVYDAIPSARREALHLQVGTALRADTATDPAQAFAVAHHFSAAARPDLAVDTLLEAARQAQALHALDDARGLLLRASQCAADAGCRAEVAELLGDIAFEQDDRGEARKQWVQALALQRTPARRSALCYQLARTYAGDPGLQRRMHCQALAEAPTGSIEAARAFVALAWNAGPAADDGEGSERQAARCFAAAMRILRRNPTHPYFLEILVGRLPYVRDRRRANLPRVRRILRRSIRLGEAQGSWRTVIRAHTALAGSHRGTDLPTAAWHAQEALRLAEAYYPPDNPVFEMLWRQLYQMALAAGDAGAAARWVVHLQQRAADDPLVARLIWRDDPERQWQALTRRLTDPLAPCRAKYQEGTLTRCLSALQRLAAERGWGDRWRDFVDRLTTDNKAALMAVGLGLWELRPAPAPATTATAALGASGLADLAWCQQTGSSQIQQLSATELEIVPSPEVGLGWLNHAPTLLMPVAGDFVLQARIAPASHPRHAGGLVVRQNAHRLLRFASGVDHVGQVSLGQHNGAKFTQVTMIHLPHTQLHLHLSRRGTTYEARFSPDGAQWYQAGQVAFGDPGEVAVGLFAECNYEYEFPQPFPIRFDQVCVIGTRSAGPATVHSATRPQAAAASRLYPLPERPPAWHGMVGDSPVFRGFCTQLEQVGRSSLPLLLWGETGTGKELAARAVHALSGRKGPFVPVNVSTLPNALFESELFGHRKGAFTGANEDRPGLFRAAAGGTLFLDEIGELPAAVQAALLRALEAGEIRAVGDTQALRVDCRCLAATSRNLALDAQEGTFRKDLYYRLGEPVEVPPLRHRRDDIVALVAHLLALPTTPPVRGITRAAMAQLQAHDWPGNVRELRNTLDRAAARAGGQAVDEPHLRLGPPPAPTRPAMMTPTPPELRQCLDDHGQNVSAVARAYGVNRRTVYRWLQRAGLGTQHLRA